VAIIKASDEQIRGWVKNWRPLEKLLNSKILSWDCCFLCDYWTTLHFLLTRQSADLPMCALRQGEVQFPDLSDPAHAIFSATTRELSAQLRALSPDALQQRWDSKYTPVTDDYPGRYWLLGDLSDVMPYFRRLSDYAASASADGLGLVFCHYEDW
jgi:hypothetical protein